MADKKQRLIIADLRGGRNGAEPAWAIKDTQCADAVNVEFYKSRLGRKRNGFVASSVTNDPGFAGGILFVNLFRYVPGTDDTAAELWGTTSGDQITRLAAGITWALPTLKDAMSANFGEFATAVGINAKLFWGYKSAVARHHVWDGSTVRRAGLAATVAPTAADGGGGGAYPATLRYYRQRSTRQSGGVTLGRSEPSPSVSFTPSGANLNATVTQAAVINEGETHWEVEASIDNITFYRIATVVIGTTTYADTALVATYNTNPLSASTGFYTLQKPYKFVAADQNRHLGFGSYTATDKQSRIEYSAVIGSSDVSDEERVDTTTNYFADLDEADSGVPTGLGGPIFGSFFAFKEKQTWQGTPTGNVAQPFRWDAISKSVGAVNQQSVSRGEDEDGNPALYWMSQRGPYRWGLKGLQYIGAGIEDYVQGPTAVFNLNAASVLSRTMFYPEKRQMYYWWATGTSDTPVACAIYDITSGGWSRIDNVSGLLAFISAAVMFANTIAASMSKDLHPYWGYTDLVKPVLYKGDSGTQDGSVTLGPFSFQGYVTTKAYELGGPGFYSEVGDAELSAAVATGVTITAITIADFGEQTNQSPYGTVSLAQVGSSTRITKRVENSALAGDVRFFQYQIGDAAVTTAAWNLDRFVVPYARRGEVTG